MSLYSPPAVIAAFAALIVILVGIYSRVQSVHQGIMVTLGLITIYLACYWIVVAFELYQTWRTHDSRR